MGSIQNQSVDEVAVIMVPFPAQGHLNQLLQLSCLIVSNYHLPVYYISSAVHNRQVKTRANGLNPIDVARIRFHDIPTPEFASPAPNPDSDNKFPVQLLPCWEASLSHRQRISAFFEEISGKAKRVVVIHDLLMGFVVQDFAAVPGAESYVFNCASAFTQAALKWEFLGKTLPLVFEKSPPSMDGCVPEEASALLATHIGPMNLKSGELYNTCRLIEGPYMDLLEREDISGVGNKSWAIGPILPAPAKSNLPSTAQKHECLRWLDEQEPKSVIYVSFGSTTSLSDEEIIELATGLERSKQKFIWVLRDGDKGDIFSGAGRQTQLPEGMEERVKGIGIVVRDWAPQPEILAHPSTGGFMSHCGWNSCIESLAMGVPVAAWPMHSDQPRNSFLMTEILKVGIEVKEWDPKAGEIARASTVENAVKRLMSSEEGAAIRRRSEEVRDSLRRATEEAGVSRAELDSFVAHITR